LKAKLQQLEQAIANILIIFDFYVIKQAMLLVAVQGARYD